MARSASFIVFATACSKPATWVPPLGVAMMLTNDLTVVSYPVPQRIATSTPSSRVTSVGVIWPCSSSTGTVSLKLPCPVKRRTSQTGRSPARNSQNSLMPPSKRKDSSPLLPPSPRPNSSRTSMVSPGTRNAVWRARWCRFSRESLASLRKICRSAQYRTRVPVRVLGIFFLALRSPLPASKPASGPAPLKAPGTPRRKLMECVYPSRSTSMSSRLDRAFTTEAPTPCRPPEAA